ncbi:MAG: c-type cytochrome, partial [Polyangiaceae bacterium]
IFAKYMNGTTGTWKCASSNCHGPTGTAGIPTNQPAIDGTNAQAAYNSLTQYLVDDKPYINACTTDPSGSAMDCNLKGACEAQMPTSGAGVASAAATPTEIGDVETWLRCGAPFN